MKLRGAILFVKDLDAMVAFYRDAAGMTPLADSASQGWLEFESGLALHAIPAEIAVDVRVDSVREETPIKLVFAVDDVEAMAARLERFGARVMRRHWGAVDVVDPEGNIFQLSGR